MKRFLIIALVAISAIFISLLASRNFHPFNTQDSNVNSENIKDVEEDSKLWVDTVMYANGHSFGYSGDVSMWGGWYFDTIPVGDDIMLTCDSIGPSKLKLSIITRELTVDMRDANAVENIKQFMNPIKNFKRFQKNYEVMLDSVVSPTYGTLK